MDPVDGQLKRAKDLPLLPVIMDYLGVGQR